jgi:superfamily II DNA/RNA helicase
MTTTMAFSVHPPPSPTLVHNHHNKRHPSSSWTRLHVAEQMHNNNNNNNNPNKKQPQQRPPPPRQPRFVQNRHVVGHSKSTTTTTSTSSSKTTPSSSYQPKQQQQQRWNETNDSFRDRKNHHHKNSNNDARQKTTTDSSFTRKHPSDITTTPTTTTTRTRRSSIEDLEAKLEQKWGDYNKEFRQSSSNTMKNNKDPLFFFFENDDDMDMDVHSFGHGNDDDENHNDNKMTQVLEEQRRRRPIKNRSPTKSSSIVDATATVSPLSAFARKNNKNNNNKNPRSESPPPSSSTQMMMKVSHLIAPHPAGGMGTRQLQPPPPQQSLDRTTTTTKKNKQSSSIHATENQPPPEQPPPPKENQPTPSILPRPIVDPNTGEPMYLTLAQAERIFQQQQQQTQSETPARNTDSSSKEKIIMSTAVVENDHRPEFTTITTTTATTKIPSSSWQDLGITHELLIQNLQTMGAHTPLQVQSASIPSILLQNRDVLLSTYTGSGKTLAFLTPIVQKILAEDSNEWYVLIVAPGRELASQIVTVARQLLWNNKVSNRGTAMLAIGGTTFARNLADIRKHKPNIIVGTPGRVAELLLGSGSEKRGRLKLPFGSLVLDEFDALLEYKPHRDPTRAILAHLQKQNPNLQTIMCSATASDVDASGYLKPNFAHITADPNDVWVTDDSHSSTRVSRTVMHGVVHVPHVRFQYEYIRRILHTEPLPPQILIFGQDSRHVETIVDKLSEFNILAAPLHGGRQSTKMDRADVAKALRQGTVGIVVATELAARGLDAPITHVINLALPTSPSHYAHRAGRCGRNGRPGIVINMTTKPQERNVPQKFAETLGIPMHTVQVRNSKLNVIDPESLNLDEI